MIIFFGPVGAGKSVQGQMLADKMGWSWLSTGQMFRESTNPDVIEILKSGELMSDEKTFLVVQEAFENHKDAKRVIVDGFPRTEPQAKWLFDEAGQLGREVAMVISLEVPDEEIYARLSSRGRDEDTPETVTRRMEIYRSAMKPITQLFEAHDVEIAQIDGTGTVEEIHERIYAAVKNSQAIE